MFKLWSEAHEQSQLVRWLELNNYKFTAVPNDTFTESWSVKNKNKALWVRPWMSDLIVLLKNKPAVLFLEMKKAKWPNWGMNGSVVSQFQLGWQEEINKVPSCQYSIAHWFTEAKELIERLENV